MKHLKELFRVSALLLLTVVCVMPLVSCSDDDEQEAQLDAKSGLYYVIENNACKIVAHDDCKYFTEVEVPASIDVVGENGAVRQLPVTAIAPKAFRECPNLKKVTLGENIASVGTFAFFGCHSLETVVANMTTPPSVKGNMAFSGISPKAVLTVPADAVNEYAAAGWKNYFAEVKAATVETTPIEKTDDEPVEKEEEEVTE